MAHLLQLHKTPPQAKAQVAVLKSDWKGWWGFGFAKTFVSDTERCDKFGDKDQDLDVMIWEEETWDALCSLNQRRSPSGHQTRRRPRLFISACCPVSVAAGVSVLGCPQREMGFLWLRFVCRSPERASFTRSCLSWNRSSPGGKLRTSGALTPPPRLERSANLISCRRYLERIAQFSLQRNHCWAGASAGLSRPAKSRSNPHRSLFIHKSNSHPLRSKPWLKKNLNPPQYQLGKMSPKVPIFSPSAFVGDSELDSPYQINWTAAISPIGSSEKVLAPQRVFCSWLWLMGKLLRIIVRRKDPSEPMLPPPCCWMCILWPWQMGAQKEGKKRHTFRLCVTISA